MALVALAHAQSSPAVGVMTLPAAASGSSMENVPEHSQRLSGRLFFSREQRERIDRARARGEFSHSDKVFGDPTPSLLNGFVSRSDGQITVWIDGQVRYDAQSKEMHRLTPQDVGNPDERVSVKTNDAPVSTGLKRKSKAGSEKPARVRGAPMTNRSKSQ